MGYYHYYWTCPYYKWDERRSVHCEGGRIGLPTNAAAREYFRTYCCDIAGWKRCTVARAISRHYETADEP